MPKKRKCKLKALPDRQCKRPKISFSLRENRKAINYDETIEISSEDSKGKLENSHIDDIDDSSNSSVVILDSVNQAENGKPSFFESINISFHDERNTEVNTGEIKGNDGEIKNVENSEEMPTCNEKTSVEDENIIHEKVDNEELDIPINRSCGSTISLSSCDSKSTSSKRKRRTSKKPPTISEEIFYVEKIIEMKIENGKRLFYLKWEGFPDSENSWEPEENIQSNVMVEEFLENWGKHDKVEEREKIELETSNSNKNDEVDASKTEKVSDTDCNAISGENIANSSEDSGNINNVKEEISNTSNPSSVIVISNENSISTGDQGALNTDYNDNQDNNQKKSLEDIVDINEENKTCTTSNIPINDNIETFESNILVTNSEKEMTIIVDHNESTPIETNENQVLETVQPGIVSQNSETHLSTSSLGLSFRRKRNRKGRKKTKLKVTNKEVNNTEKMVPVEPDEIFPLVSLRTRKNMKSLKEILDCSDHSDISDHENMVLDKSENHDSDSSELSTKSTKKTDSKDSIDHNSYFPTNLPQNVQEIFMVEKILKMKIINGVRKFFLKWEGFPDSENTWEPEENLECPELIKEFLKEQKKIRSTKKRKRLSSADSLNLEELPEEVQIKEPVVKPRGFPRSREPETILAAGMMNDQMMFLIKWKNVDMANLVSARRANIECPQVVIRFYENHLNWENTDHLNLTSVPRENLANPIDDEFTKISKTLSKKSNPESASTMNCLMSLLENENESTLIRKSANFSKPKPKVINRKSVIPHRGRPLTKLFDRKTNVDALPKKSIIGSSTNKMMNLINNFKVPKPQMPQIPVVTNIPARPLPQPTPLENLSREYDSREIPKEQSPPPKFELPKPNQTPILRPINSYRPDFIPRRFGVSSRPLLNVSHHSQNISQKIVMPTLTPSLTMPALKAAPKLAIIHQPNSAVNFHLPASNYDPSSLNTYIEVNNSLIDQKPNPLNGQQTFSNSNNNNFNHFLNVVDSITNNSPISQTTLNQLLQPDQKPSFNQVIEPQINNYLQSSDQSINNNNFLNNNPINQMRSMTASMNQQGLSANRASQSDFQQNYTNNNNNNNNRNSTRMQLASAIQTRFQNTNQIITMHPNIIPATNLSYLSNNQLNSLQTPQYQYVINSNHQQNYNQNNLIQQQQQQQQQQTYYTQQPSMSPSALMNVNARFILPKMDTFTMQTSDMNQHLLQSSQNNQYQQHINPQNNQEILQNSYLLEHFCN